MFFFQNLTTELFLLESPDDSYFPKSGGSTFLKTVGSHFSEICGNKITAYIAKHSETLEDMVVYQAMYGEHGIWVRPADMFEEVIEREGKIFRRFEPISEDEAKSIIDNA